MKITKIRIINLKGIKDIEFNTDAQGILIVGPNAVGKSTIFEAIRLNKAFLFPNIQGETNMVLTSIKAISPNQQGVITNTLLNDRTKKLEISIEYSIEESEIETVKKSFFNNLIIKHLQNTNRFPVFRESFSEAQYLSSEPGKQMMELGRLEIDSYLKTLLTTKKAIASLTIDNLLISGSSLLDQEFLAILCETSGYSYSYFNYFPADRSLPLGDQPLQIGFQNANQQLQSYIANPQSKYLLIKQFIINMYFSSNESKKMIEETFELIFDSLLPGKNLGGVGINPNGNISIWINDTIKGSHYDIDSMSSGEKNLLLTILFMDLTTNENGIILFDEPELHLNPAVQKKIINYLIDTVCNVKNRQIILSTHSPEMFATAFERNDCKIYHLISGNDISVIYKKDKAEVFSVLQKLGSSSTDLLSTKGIIYLEGPHDTELLDFAITTIMPGYAAKYLGGRKEIEKNIKTLQDEDKKGTLDSYQLFLFDLDNLPTSLKSTKNVILLQWDRYCLENYLLNSDTIFDVIKENGANQDGLTRGSMLGIIKNIAFMQINKIGAKDVVLKYLTDEIYIKITEILTDNPEETVNNLFSILDKIAASSIRIKTDFRKDVVLSEIQKRITSIKDDWESKWIIKCDGKQVLIDIHKEYKLRISLLDFKKKIMEFSYKSNNEDWKLIESKLKELISMCK